MLDDRAPVAPADEVDDPVGGHDSEEADGNHGAQAENVLVRQYPCAEKRQVLG